MIRIDSLDEAADLLAVRKAQVKEIRELIRDANERGRYFEKVARDGAARLAEITQECIEVTQYVTEQLKKEGVEL
ncbi:hypothetical protein [Streptomyces sp. NPDC046925]|uniref:hypothetical protein n=1 Tax=Streptomyces sp. NPDC046925 TaxID=3155375 RepID=UPI0033E56AB3